MHITSLSLVREERISEAYALPAGRRIHAELTILPTAPALARQGHADTLELQAEVKRPGGEFEVVVSTGAASEPGTYRCEIPTEAVAPPVMAPVPVFRLRLIHEGRSEPYYRIKVAGY